MKNNQGFTLIELIVVIAIMGIIAGISGSSLSGVSNQELKNFVNTYDAMLSECKVETMSGMPDPMLEIMVVEKDGNDEYEAILYETEKRNNAVSKTIVKEEYLGEDYLDFTCTYAYVDANGVLKKIRMTVSCQSPLTIRQEK